MIDNQMFPTLLLYQKDTNHSIFNTNPIQNLQRIEEVKE